jgi:hypothetical protein
MSDFTFQYAVRLPNGDLFTTPKPTAYSPVMQFFGATQEPMRELAVFDELSDAEEALEQMRRVAAQVGVDNLGATIVTRICSPFLADHDDAGGFVAHINEWIEGRLGMSDLLDQIFGGDLYIGECHECRQAKSFRTERERDLWQRNHAHQEYPA